jgi:hypothetical protein
MIETVKKKGTGYLINGNDISVTPDERNTDYKAVLQWIADGGIVEDEFTAEELDTKRIADIKATAKQKILSVMSEDKQRNSLAELIALSVTPQIEWTAEMVTLFTTHKAAWNMIDAIRATSNEAEAAGTAAEDVAWPI